MNEINYKKETSRIYGNLFANYSESLFDESVDLFFKRSKIWSNQVGLGNELEWFKDKKCLDAGVFTMDPLPPRVAQF